MTKKKRRQAPTEVPMTPPAEPASDEDDGWGTVYRWAKEEPYMRGLQARVAAHARGAEAAGRYPLVVSAADIERFRADPATLKLPVIGTWQPTGCQWLNEHWVDLTATGPGARTEDDEALRMLTMTVAELIELMVPGHAYGIVLDEPNWQSVVEFMPPSRPESMMLPGP